MAVIRGVLLEDHDVDAISLELQALEEAGNGSADLSHRVTFGQQW